MSQNRLAVNHVLTKRINQIFNMKSDGYLINHVMSKDVESGIFSAIMKYFKEYSPNWVRHEVSILPIEGAAIHHYHRPHLEKKLVSNSVCTVHHDLDDPDVWHSKPRFLPRYMEAAGVICLNQTQKQILYADGIAEDQLYVVPHGYNDKVLRLRSNINTGAASDKVNLGIASRRYARRVKGEAYLSELVKRLDPDLFSFTFVGQDRSIDAIAFRRLGFEVTVFERLPYRVFQSYYEAIDALLMCSSHEGGPANIPEAIATGTPVLSSPIGMAKDLIRHGHNGMFLTLDPQTDADMINSLCEDNRASLNALKRRSLSKASSALTWRQSVEGNLRAYSNILGTDLLKPPTIESENFDREISIKNESSALEPEAMVAA